MPTCDRAEFVPVAVASFLAQDFTDSELLVLDDGTQPVDFLVREVSPRVKYVRCEKKLNTGQKRNLAAELADGEIIAHFDDDDWSHPTRLSQQIARMDASGKPVTGYSSVFFYDQRDGQCYRYRGGRMYTLGTSQCYLKSWWSAHRFQESLIGEDTAFGHEASRCNALDVCEGEGMIVAVVHGRNTSPKPLNSSIYMPVEKSVLPSEFFAARA